jgi:hypothetical protein
MLLSHFAPSPSLEETTSLTQRIWRPSFRSSLEIRRLPRQKMMMSNNNNPMNLYNQALIKRSRHRKE